MGPHVQGDQEVPEGTHQDGDDHEEDHQQAVHRGQARELLGLHRAQPAHCVDRRRERFTGEPLGVEASGSDVGHGQGCTLHKRQRGHSLLAGRAG